MFNLFIVNVIVVIDIIFIISHSKKQRFRNLLFRTVPNTVRNTPGLLLLASVSSRLCKPFKAV